MPSIESERHRQRPDRGLRRLNVLSVAMLLAAAAAGLAGAGLTRHWAPLALAAAIGTALMYAPQIAQRWERAVVLRYVGLRGPGLFWLAPAVLAAASVAQAQAPAPAAAAWTDPSPHQVRFVDVAPGVRLEVLDWGGTGRDVVLLTGSGHTAHVYDEFAPKLKDCCHVYGITRRGYGASSLPESGYDEPSLSDDVWTVVRTLGLKLPVLIGHSMAGAELTGVGMLHSSGIGGLVYLDALGDATDDPPDDPARKALEPRLPPPGPPPSCTEDRTSFPAFQAFMRCRHGITLPESELRQGFAASADGGVGGFKTPGWVSRAIGTGRPARDYSRIKVPVLAISDAVDLDLSKLKPEHPQPRNDEERAIVLAFGKATQAVFDRWSANLKRGVPAARIVDMPGAGHYLWMTREAEVLREIRAFVARLPAPR